jgi:hypothetical protein
MAARPALHTAGSADNVPGPVGAAYARLSQTAAVAKNGLTPRTGVVYAGNQALLTATASTSPMQVTVKPLHYVGSKAAAQGTYWGANDGDYPLTIAAAPGSGSRTDVVYIMQQDSSPGTTSPDASTAAVIAATSGALPAGAVRIGSVVVPAGVTKLTDAGVVVTTDCQWTAAAGAPIPVSSKAQRDALTTYMGLQVLRLDVGHDENNATRKGRIETWDGVGWHTYRFGTETCALGAHGDFTVPATSTGLTTVLWASVANGSGALDTNARQNITVARNVAFNTVPGAVTGRIYAAEDHSEVTTGSVVIDWRAEGYQ